MATPAQVLANRENAHHSTGPTSPQGKATSAANATRHSLTARGFIVPVGLENAFAEFEAGLRRDLIPNGPIQELLFKRILECGWNLERCRRAEAELFETGLDPLLHPEHDPQFARIAKYARQYENSMYKAIRGLRTLQTEAQFRHELHPLTAEEIEDPELFETTPQSLSALCNYQKATACSRKPRFQNEANSDQEAIEFLDRLTALPPLRYDADDAEAA